MFSIYRRWSYVLVASVCKNNDGKACKGRYDSHPLKHADLAAGLGSIARGKVIDDKNDKVANRDERNHAGVLERVESAQK